jgi:hypothetical protein
LVRLVSSLCSEYRGSKTDENLPALCPAGGTPDIGGEFLSKIHPPRVRSAQTDLNNYVYKKSEYNDEMMMMMMMMMMNR